MKTDTKLTMAIVTPILILAIWLPRGLKLDQFVTPDEAAWVGRSASFYYALAHRNFPDTFQHSHPGVTATWAGAFVFYRHYTAFSWEATRRPLKNWKYIEPFLEAHGQDPLEILKSIRLLIVLGNTTVLGLAFLSARRLIGLWPAAIGFILIAFDPFHVGLTRLLHLDGLMGNLMLLAVLAFMNFTYQGRHLLDLALATTATGLAWLTKSPSLFLVPFISFLMVVEIWNRRQGNRRLQLGDWWQSIWPLIILLLGSALVFVLLWPAMWVDPLGTLEKMSTQTKIYAIEGHSLNTFFNGHIFEGDPGWAFYPVNYLWRTTPVVLAGLCLAGLTFRLRWWSFKQLFRRRVAVWLVLFAILFMLQMSFGAKKFDRYIIPSFLPLDLLAGMGWAALFSWLWRRYDRLLTRVLIVALLISCMGWQILLTVQYSPYYLTYYNPLLGGSIKAPGVMMIGWGEGLDQAARYLNTKPDAKDLRVMTHYPDGSVSYFFDGKAMDLPDVWEGPDADQMDGIDYLILYVHQWQRQIPDPAMVEYFSTKKPELVIKINGLEYARVYNLHD